MPKSSKNQPLTGSLRRGYDGKLWMLLGRDDRGLWVLLGPDTLHYRKRLPPKV